MLTILLLASLVSLLILILMGVIIVIVDYDRKKRDKEVYDKVMDEVKQAKEFIEMLRKQNKNE